MTGACIIDGVDIATLGMFIKRGGDTDFISFPERKEPLLNDWFEHDGVELDYSSLTLAPKKVKVDYYLSAASGTLFNARLNAFQNIHMASGLRQIYLREFDRTFHLQTIEMGKMEHKGGLYKQGRKSANITVEYMDNNPAYMFPETFQSPVGNGLPTRVVLNGIDLNVYGITINEFYSTALSLYSPKQGIVREQQFTDGALVDVAFIPKREPRKLAMQCTLTASYLNAFWYNYTALFYELTRQQTVVFSLSNGSTINCYYTGMAGLKKLAPFNRRIIITFTLHFSEI